MVLQFIFRVPESEVGSQQSLSGEHKADECGPAQEIIPGGLAPIVRAQMDRAEHDSAP